jgi:hypothetical protein
VTAARNLKTSRSTPGQTDEAGFAEIVELIASSREHAFQAVNTVLIDLYWKVGEIISARISNMESQLMEDGSFGMNTTNCGLRKSRSRSRSIPKITRTIPPSLMTSSFEWRGHDPG